jgi:hypothetical protein
MKIITSKLFRAISLMLLSIILFIIGIEHQVVAGRIGYSLCSASFFIGALVSLYEWARKFKNPN